MWGTVNPEVREDSIHMLEHSSEDESMETSPASDYSSLLFGRLMVRNSLTSIHPAPVLIFRLWQIFLSNVNPVTKVIHAPTVQELLLQAMGDLDKISASTEALMFAIYHCAIVSMDDQSCQDIFNESRVVALAKYSTATQQALVNAKLLRTSNLVVLQALILYLVSIRPSTDHDTIWVLAGIATKIGQRMGLHSESASASASLPILEAEIRRRVWWQILILEGRSSFLSGSATPAAILSYRPSRLLNVNDSDLLPTMREPPTEQAAITEMLFTCINYEISRFMLQAVIQGDSSIRISPEQLAAKLKAVDDLEASLEQRYIRYCDISIPLHYLARLVVRGALSKMRLRLYSTPRSADAPPQTQAEKDAGFAMTVTMLEIDNEGFSSNAQEKLKGFMWYINAFFQLEAFIFMLSELRTRTTGAQVDWAWELVEATYSNHGEILREMKNKLWVAVGNLCLKAWEQRVKGLESQRGAAQLSTPTCVRKLYAQRGIQDRSVSGRGSQQMVAMSLSNEMDLSLMQNGQVLDTQWGDVSMPSTYVPSFDSGDSGATMDWEYWQTLFDDCGVPLFK